MNQRTWLRLLCNILCCKYVTGALPAQHFFVTHGTTRHGYTECVVLQRMIAVYSRTLCADAAMHCAAACWVSVSAYIVMENTGE